MRPAVVPDKFFGFSEFIAAMALLVVVFTITDVRHKFRTSIAPIPLHFLTFWAAVVIGFATLANDLWRVGKLPILATGALAPHYWEALLGLAFLGVVLAWMYFAFIQPPIFSKYNATRFGQAIYRSILKGAEDELAVVADECRRSIRAIVEGANRAAAAFERDQNAGGIPRHDRTAYDLITLLGDRRFCRAVISRSPLTAATIFEELARSGGTRLPIGHLVQNLANESIIQRESLLREELKRFPETLHGRLGHLTHAMFGNFLFVENCSDRSALDISYTDQADWTPDEWEAFCNATLTLLKSKVHSSSLNAYSYVIHRAIGRIGRSVGSLYQLNGVPSLNWHDVQFRQLRVAVDFLQSAVELIQKAPELPRKQARRPDALHGMPDIYDDLGTLAMTLVDAASSVAQPRSVAWTVQHNSVWSELFSFKSGLVWDRVQSVLASLLLKELRQMNDLPNFRGAAVLGFLLNVEGLTDYKRGNAKHARALGRIARRWARENYLSLRERNPHIADACLIGSIEFDADRLALAKVFERGLSAEAPRDYLPLLGRPVTATPRLHVGFLRGRRYKK